MASDVELQLDSLAKEMEGNTSEKLNAILDFLVLKRNYGALKLLKPQLASFQKAHTTKGNRQLAREAKIIDGAKTADSSSKRTRAETRLKTLVEESQIEEVKTIAKQVLDGLTGEGGSLSDL